MTVKQRDESAQALQEQPRAGAIPTLHIASYSDVDDKGRQRWHVAWRGADGRWRGQVAFCPRSHFDRHGVRVVEDPTLIARLPDMKEAARLAELEQRIKTMRECGGYPKWYVDAIEEGRLR